MFRSGYSLSGQCFVSGDDDAISRAGARPISHSSSIAQALPTGAGAKCADAEVCIFLFCAFSRCRHRPQRLCQPPDVSQCRQSRRLADRLFSFRHADRLLVRFAVGATILGFGVMMAGFRRREGHPWAPLWQNRRSRSRRRGRRGGRDRLGWDGRAAGADLSVAGRDGGANRASDASRILCAVIRCNSCVSCRDRRHPWPHLGGGRHPCALCPAGWPVARSIGDRLGSDGFALLAITLLTAAGLYTVAAAGVGLLTRQP